MSAQHLTLRIAIGLVVVMCSGRAFAQPATPLASVLVEAVGQDSGSYDVNQGFWRITHVSGELSIVAVQFDFEPTWPSDRPGRRFDVDQETAFGCFALGQAIASGQTGTYRGGSAAACGLIFDSQNSATPLPQSLQHGLQQQGRTGYQVSDLWIAQPTLEEYRKLHFRFSNGVFRLKNFSFDCDTDGHTRAQRGSDMAGLAVTLTFSDNSTATGSLSADPANPLRSFALLVRIE